MIGGHVELRGLAKRYGALEVLRAVDLVLEPGTRNWLAGPNGAGKSTLLDLIVGAQRASAGQLLYDGLAIEYASMPMRARLGIARSWQMPQVFADHSVHAQLLAAVRVRREPRVALGLGRVGTDVWDGEVQMLARRWGLHERLDAMPAQLSHAERRLLDLALAFAGWARVMLLDEPSAGLSRHDAGELFERLAEYTQGQTVLIVEHDRRLASAFAEHAFVLRDGRVHADA